MASARRCEAKRVCASVPWPQEVLWRVGNSFIGAFRANFMLTTQERPDL